MQVPKETVDTLVEKLKLPRVSQLFSGELDLFCSVVRILTRFLGYQVEGGIHIVIPITFSYPSMAQIYPKP